MAFQVYPDEAGNSRDRPLSVAAGASTGLKSIGPLAASGTTFIRIAWRPAGGPDPSVTLKADGGDETAIPIDGMTHFVLTANGLDAGDAILEPALNGVYRLRIFLQTAATWQINLKNNDAVGCTLTWVVADSDNESQQPWIHATFRNAVPAAVAFDANVGQRVEERIDIKNFGTGPLGVGGLTPAIAAPYAISGLPVTLGPNQAQPAVVTIAFNAPNTPSDTPISSYTFITGDKTDFGPFGSGHNNTLSLRAHTHRFAPSFAASPNQFRPTRGRHAGERPGCEVTLFGNHLNEGNVSVHFGEIQAPIRSISLAKIVVTVPEMEPATVKITVKTGGGSVTSDDDFRVLPLPVIESLDPNNGRPGDTFAVVGTNFNLDVEHTVGVFFTFPTDPTSPPNPGPLKIVGSPTPTEIIATVPPMSREIECRITIARSDGAEVTSDQDFSVTLL